MVHKQLNKIGHLDKDTRSKSDEILTPKYVVKPILKYIPKNYIVWCPFDKSYSKFVRLLKKRGNRVVCSHIDEGKDFFKYKPKNFDCIISNPPFSKKDAVLKRCYSLGKPFSLLLPITALGGAKRQKLYSLYGCEVLFLGGRIGFYTKNDLSTIKEKTGFECVYVCHNILPDKMIYEKVKKTQEPYFRRFKV